MTAEELAQAMRNDEVDEAIAAKMQAAVQVMRDAGPLGLDPSKAEAGGYDLEAAVISGALPSKADPTLAAETVRYVMRRTSGEEIPQVAAEAIAASLLHAMPDDGLDPKDFPWPVIRELVERALTEQ